LLSGPVLHIQDDRVLLKAVLVMVMTGFAIIITAEIESASIATKGRRTRRLHAQFHTARHTPTGLRPLTVAVWWDCSDEFSYRSIRLEILDGQPQEVSPPVIT
jgi:hypothetical protein